MGSKPSSLAKSGNDNSSPEPKKSLYRRYEDAKRGPLSDDDIKKYTGMSKDQISDWSKDRPGVAGNRNAGDITVGPASGFGGVAAGEGYGGWGPGANGKLKFPPEKKAEGKQLSDDEIED